VWQGQLSVSTSTDVTAAVVVEHCAGAELRDVAVTVAVYARYAGATYIDAAHTSRLTLDAFGSHSVSGVIDIELLLMTNLSTSSTTVSTSASLFAHSCHRRHQLHVLPILLSRAQMASHVEISQYLTIFTRSRKGRTQGRYKGISMNVCTMLVMC